MKLLFLSLAQCITLLVAAQGNVGIGTITPSSKLHIVHNSTLQSAQLKLEENENDFARLRFSNTVYAMPNRLTPRLLNLKLVARF